MRKLLVNFTRMAVAALAVTAIVSCDRSGPQRDAPADQPVGSMVGHVTSTSATIWAHGGPNARMVLRWSPQAGSPVGESSTAMQVDPAAHHSGRFVIDDLQPATAYQYVLTIGGTSRMIVGGRFTTAPPEGRPARFKIAVSSCIRHEKNHSSFTHMLERRPSFQILLGDNVYADTTDHAELFKAHLAERRVPEFAAVIQDIPTYATWDDHDFAGNNSDGTAPGKEQSLEAFKQLWANPGAGTDEVPGVFYRFRWADVDFFVLDGRYHRSPNTAPNDDKKRMLGDGQFRWLAEGLKASDATFKVIAQGSVLSLDETDGWLTFDFARERIFRLIADHRIAGVLWVSGDLHRSLVVVHPKAQTGFYDLYEVISSGIAYRNIRSFATLEFDTTLDDPSVRIRIINGDDTVADQRTLKLSQLQIERD